MVDFGHLVLAARLSEVVMRREIGVVMIASAWRSWNGPLCTALELPLKLTRAG